MNLKKYQLTYTLCIFSTFSHQIFLAMGNYNIDLNTVDLNQTILQNLTQRFNKDADYKLKLERLSSPALLKKMDAEIDKRGLKCIEQLVILEARKRRMTKTLAPMPIKKRYENKNFKNNTETKSEIQKRTIKQTALVKRKKNNASRSLARKVYSRRAKKK